MSRFELFRTTFCKSASLQTLPEGKIPTVHSVVMLTRLPWVTRGGPQKLTKTTIIPTMMLSIKLVNLIFLNHDQTSEHLIWSPQTDSEKKQKLYIKHYWNFYYETSGRISFRPCIWVLQFCFYYSILILNPNMKSKTNTVLFESTLSLRFSPGESIRVQSHLR